MAGMPEIQISPDANPATPSPATTCQQCGTDAGGSTLCAPCWAETAGDAPWLSGYLGGLEHAASGTDLAIEIAETRGRLARVQLAARQCPE